MIENLHCTSLSPLEYHRTISRVKPYIYRVMIVQGILEMKHFYKKDEINVRSLCKHLKLSRSVIYSKALHSFTREMIETLLSDIEEQTRTDILLDEMRLLIQVLLGEGRNQRVNKSSPSSYTLKHILQQYTNVYMTNEKMKELMNDLDFKSDNDFNARYNLNRKTIEILFLLKCGNKNKILS